MKRRDSLTKPCLLLAIAAWTSAFQAVPQSTEIELIDLSPWTLTWPAALSSASVGKAVHGEFTGDRTPDVWQQTDTDLVLFMDPSYMDYQLVHSVATSSIAKFPAATPGAKDDLLIADSNGLSLVTFDLLGTNLVTATPLGFTAWAGAKSISCTDLDNDGDLDILGINSFGTKLLRLMSNGSGGYTAAADVNLGSGAFETFAMNYDTPPAPPAALPEPQIAVLTQSWMFVMHQSGVRSRTLSTYGVPGHMAKVSQVPTASGLLLPDCVAWLHNVTGESNQQLAVIDSRASLQTEVPLGPLGASSICAGDVNGDGSDDVCLLTGTSHQSWTLINQRNPLEVTIDRFTDTALAGRSLSTSAAPGLGNASTPVLADLNLDGHADLFEVDRDNLGVPHVLAVLTNPVTAPDGMFELFGFKVGGEADSQHPCFQRGDYYPPSYFCTEPLAWNDGLLMLSIKDVWGISDETGWSLDLVVYRQDGPNGSGIVPGVACNAVVRHSYSLDGGTSNLFYQHRRPWSRWSFPVFVPEVQVGPDLGPFFPQKYFIVVQPVPPSVPDADQPLTQFIAGFTSDELIAPPGGGTPEPSATGPFAYLTSLPGSWGISTPHFLTEHSNSCPGTDREQEVSVGTVPLTRVPRYQQNGPPHPGTPVPHPAPIGGGN